MFKKYCEIENTYRVDFIQKIKDLNLDPNIQFACFNKVDGSNFSIILDENDNFLYAKRTNIVSPSEKFQNCEHVINTMDLVNKIKKIKEYVIKKFDINKTYGVDKCLVQIYGELCGGMYRHHDVEKVKQAVKIQGRVSYHPDNIWIPFDGFIQISDNRIIYFNVDELADICKVADLPCQVEKFRGTLDECLNFNPEFVDDTGHVLFGLPIIEDNISEGVVIKPVYPIWFPNGERVILKNKNERFKEKTKKNKIQKIEVPLNEYEYDLILKMEECITESRLMSVFSKESPSSDNEFGKIIGCYMKDIIDEVLKENSYFESLIKNETVNFKRVKKIIQENVKKYIKPMFWNYIAKN